MPRVLIDRDPFLDPARPWYARGVWPARWVTHPEADTDRSALLAFRCPFTLAENAIARIHVTADQHYALFLDGVRIARGPERGDRNHWAFETHDLVLDAGHHVLVARVAWVEPDLAAWHQVTIRPGFLLAAEGPAHPLLSTGVAPWEALELGGCTFLPRIPRVITGATLRVDAARFPWGYTEGKGIGWVPAVTLAPGVSAAWPHEQPEGHRLRPATLPDMFEETLRAGRTRAVQPVNSPDTATLPVLAADSLAGEVKKWDNLLAGPGGIILPAGVRRRIIIDLEEYYCAYPLIEVSGGKGATLRVRWAESLFTTPGGADKGHRDEVEGKFFHGMGDEIVGDGGERRVFQTLTWQAGRYLEIYVETADQHLILHRLALRQTHYPLAFTGDFASDDRRLADVLPLCRRALEMCAHDAYFDCPYYERLMYAGDARLAALVTYATTPDAALPRKALETFDASRFPSGLTHSRYPTRVTQCIPPFSLWWVAMVHDYAMWRGDRPTVAARMPGIRAVLEAFRSFVDPADGLVHAPPGWNFVDWVPAWPDGMPPEADHGASSIINLTAVLALDLAGALEEWAGDGALADRNRGTAAALMSAVDAAYWAPARGLYADDPARHHFSEHAQCLALLSDRAPADRRPALAHGLLTAPDLARTTVYFNHYLFEAYRLLGRTDALLDRMSLWFGQKSLGLRTTLEAPEPSRSDCHAWGAHPLFHGPATLLGIRPTSMAFASVEIRPHLGPLEWANATVPHPQGDIEVVLTREDDHLTGRVSAPVPIRLTCNGQTRDLPPGAHEV